MDLREELRRVEGYRMIESGSARCRAFAGEEQGQWSGQEEQRGWLGGRDIGEKRTGCMERRSCDTGEREDFAQKGAEGIVGGGGR
jgi:hypothetical protein